jgi:hypothetical protein
MARMRDMIRDMAYQGPTFTTGTVQSVDEATMSVDVLPDDGGEVIRDVPLRVMRYERAVGFVAIPKKKTEVIIAWLAPNRPTVFQAEEWKKLVCVNAENFGWTIMDGAFSAGTPKFGLRTTDKKVTLGDHENASHPVAQGDNVESRLQDLETAVNDLADHTHKYFQTTGAFVISDTGAPDSSSTVPGTPAVESEEVFTS